MRAQCSPPRTCIRARRRSGVKNRSLRRSTCCPLVCRLPAGVACLLMFLVFLPGWGPLGTSSSGSPVQRPLALLFLRSFANRKIYVAVRSGVDLGAHSPLEQTALPPTRIATLATPDNISGSLLIHFRRSLGFPPCTARTLQISTGPIMESPISKFPVVTGPHGGPLWAWLLLHIMHEIQLHCPAPLSLSLLVRFISPAIVSPSIVGFK